MLKIVFLVLLTMNSWFRIPKLQINKTAWPRNISPDAWNEYNKDIEKDYIHSINTQIYEKKQQIKSNKETDNPGHATA